MSANPLKKYSPEREHVVPPQGNSDQQKAERIRFWIEHGNHKLREDGLHHLHWRHVNGHYYIEERQYSTIAGNG